MIVLIVVGIMVLLAATALLAALILDVQPGAGLGWPAWAKTVLAREEEFVAAIGWQWRSWVAFRSVCIAIALLLAWGVGLAPFTLLAAVLALGLPRLALGSRAATRSNNQARGFVTLLRQFASRLKVSSQPFDTILADIARHAPRDLAFLHAAAAERDVLSAVNLAVAKSKAPLLQRGWATLLISRTRDRMALAELLQGHQIDEIQGLIDEAAEMQKLRGSQNAIIAVLSGAALFLFAVMNGVPELHAFYSTATGSLVLVGVVGVFSGSVALAKFIVRQPRLFHWDVERMAREVGRIGGA